MADKKKMSIEEILAAARRQDGGASDSAPPPDDSSSSAPAGDAPGQESSTGESTATPPAATPPAAGKKPSQMSVADMLAAARAEKSGGQPAESAPSAGSTPAAEESSQPAESAKKPGQMSVAEMLAAARGEKSKPAAPSPKKEPPAAAPAKPAPAGKAAKGAPAAAKAPSGPKDTASILAAARKEAKPGPMSKAEAAAQGKPLPPAGKTVAEPVMPQRPSYLEKPAKPAPTTRRTFFGAFTAVLFGSSLAVGFSSLFVTQLLWLLGLARFMFPNVLIEPPTVFKVGFADDYAPGQVETKLSLNSASGLCVTNTTGRPRFSPFRRSALTSGARRTGWKANRSSSVRAMEAASTRMASTLKVRLPGLSSDTRSRSPTTVSWKSTRAGPSRKKWGNGGTPRPSCRCKPFPNGRSLLPALGYKLEYAYAR
jgi:cytochrome b6-f complex iron-sulfur subunit